MKQRVTPQTLGSFLHDKPGTTYHIEPDPWFQQDSAEHFFYLIVSALVQHGLADTVEVHFLAAHCQAATADLSQVEHPRPLILAWKEDVPLEQLQNPPWNPEGYAGKFMNIPAHMALARILLKPAGAILVDITSVPQLSEKEQE